MLSKLGRVVFLQMFAIMGGRAPNKNLEMLQNFIFAQFHILKINYKATIYQGTRNPKKKFVSNERTVVWAVS